MNTTEERLADALKTTGDTLGPEDIPELNLSAAPRRRSAFGRPALIIAAAAVVTAVAAVGGTYLAQGDDTKHVRPLGQGRAGEMPGLQVVVYLCTKTSSNPSCLRSDASAEQRRSLKASLEHMPQVKKVDYESRQQAFGRFKDRFVGTPEHAQSTKPGDIPDSFWVVPRRAEDARTIMDAVLGRPGVDRVVIDR
ncbi:permease-like cell division protein FtsX [Actinomadura barringtoniae]|uniref:Permease-like cell division protein FtsX n=1 Tax=Actinomadura barringtoniae TaxID=1427535 RepID=A0A939PM01_9ACTN|nr:permease-like cell division protein FtsX [Actinomadura barringtoniae]MBO2451609.1 permease-like cell division protein FtsX [Actinomadura barringtoniae]